MFHHSFVTWSLNPNPNLYPNSGGKFQFQPLTEAHPLLEVWPDLHMLEWSPKNEVKKNPYSFHANIIITDIFIKSSNGLSDPLPLYWASKTPRTRPGFGIPGACGFASYKYGLTTVRGKDTRHSASTGWYVVPDQCGAPTPLSMRQKLCYDEDILLLALFSTVTFLSCVCMRVCVCMWTFLSFQIPVSSWTLRISALPQIVPMTRAHRVSSLGGEVGRDGKNTLRKA